MRLKLPGVARSVPASQAPPTNGATARIAHGLTVTGSMTGDVDVIIDGVLAGEVRGRNVTIGARGDVEGMLKALEITIAGRVHGRVEATIVHIRPSAQIDATIYHHKLDIERGAVVRGLRPWRPLSDMERRRAAW